MSNQRSGLMAQTVPKERSLPSRSTINEMPKSMFSALT